jgi:hypothetical protein
VLFREIPFLRLTVPLCAGVLMAEYLPHITLLQPLQPWHYTGPDDGAHAAEPLHSDINLRVSPDAVYDVIRIPAPDR